MVVELRSKVYDVISRHRANLFELRSLLPSREVVTAFQSRLREIDVTRPIVGFSVKHLCENFKEKIASEKHCVPLCNYKSVV